MIRIDLKKDDFEKIRKIISEPISLCKITEELGKFELIFDTDSEASAFLEILEEMKIKILKKRVF